MCLAVINAVMLCAGLYLYQESIFGSEAQVMSCRHMANNGTVINKASKSEGSDISHDCFVNDMQ
uniref:Uncharacterized protein n=3 Tax=Vibrio harveyi group TaxID=717610 RepID=A0A1S6KSG5_9VIBR|nr:hypothetical protein [Vibrio owensii]